MPKVCRGASVAFIALLSSIVSVAHAQGEPSVEAARELIQQARFADAVDAARALLESPALSAAERNQALEVMAIAQVADRQRDEAAETLALLYSRDPGHRLSDPNASPPVLSAFAQAREARPEPVSVRLEHSPPTLTRREAPQVVVRIAEGADAIAELRLSYRMGEEGATRVVMTERADGTYVARIPVIGDASSATDVAYQIVALAPSLTPLASAGSAAAPLQLRIPAETRAAIAHEPVGERPFADGSAPSTPAPSEGGGSVAEEWWFWTLLVAVVAGGAITAGVLLTSPDGPEQGTFGSVRLMSIELP